MASYDQFADSLDLLALPRLVHLSRREADIVVSLERPERGPVVAIRLTDYVLQLYAAAFGPGFLLAGMYILYTLVRSFINSVIDSCIKSMALTPRAGSLECPD